MTARLACCVPFCRRTVARDKLPAQHTEWICQKHWRCVPARLKRRKRQTELAAERADRRFRRDYDRQGGFTEPQLGRAVAAHNLRAAVWIRCKTAAIEALLP